MSHLIETVYNLLWGDLFTLPVGGGIGISLMAVLLLTAGVFFTLRTRLLPVRLFRDMIAAVCEKNQSMDSLSSFQTLIVSTAPGWAWAIWWRGGGSVCRWCRCGVLDVGHGPVGGLHLLCRIHTGPEVPAA